MQLFFQITFWFSVFLIFHSYVLYPFLLLLLNPEKATKIYQTEVAHNKLPTVSILMALFNEQEVIYEKLTSIFKSNYPLEKLQILIGSDNSTDKTNEIVRRFAKKYPHIYFRNFEKRQGKPSIINQLSDEAKGEIYILTDANVMLHENAIYEMAKLFQHKNVGLVDTNMVNTEASISAEGISVQESSYNLREVNIKNSEGQLWGTMMGPFGGCYAVRKSLFSKVPPNFLVDDFYICMKVLEKEYDTLSNLKSIVYEDVSNNLHVEFKRKIRIATGNFQNLKTFFPLLFSNKKGLFFSFFSHKVLRWLGPFILIFALISNLFLLDITIYKIIFGAYCFTFFIPIFDFSLKKINMHNKFLRFVTHFYSMNLALLIGAYKFTRGVKSGIWNPTQRNQNKQ